MPAIQCHGLSDRGRHRESNQDQFLIAELDKSLLVLATSLDRKTRERLYGESQGYLLLVADGIGGHAAGDEASRIAIDGVIAYVLNTLPWCFRLHSAPQDDLLGELEQAMQRSHQSIRERVRDVPDHEGMGTTLTLAYVVWPRLYLVHVGDSRCYLLRDGQLSRLTTDHTVGQRLQAAGVLEEDSGETSRLGHVLWNAVGSEAEPPTPEVYKAGLATGDVLLLCTDGLTRYLNDGELEEILSTVPEPEEACRRLVDSANQAGGEDNITAVVARLEGEVSEDDTQPTIPIRPSSG